MIIKVLTLIFCHYLKDWFTVYETTRLVKIKSSFLAIIYIVLFVLILVLYLHYVNHDETKGYQSRCSVRGAAVTKVKGAISTEDLDDSLFQTGVDKKLYKRVWDIEDLVHPSQGDAETGSFFITTNLVITPNQTKDICHEKSDYDSFNCTKDADCVRGSVSNNAVRTGHCWVHTNTCRVSGWCPLEKERSPLKNKRALLEGVEDFTVMIKNSVEFPNCDYKKNGIPVSLFRWRNIPTKYNSKDLKLKLSKCRYNPENDTTCPIFRLGDIVKWGHSDYKNEKNEISDFADVAYTGASFQIEINWNCDFDESFECFPIYRFSRVDSPNITLASRGFNFRTATYFGENSRTHYKLYGIKVLVMITGTARHFEYLTLMWTIASVFSLFEGVQIITNNVLRLLCTLKKSKHLAKFFGNFQSDCRFADQNDETETSTKVIPDSDLDDPHHNHSDQLVKDELVEIKDGASSSLFSEFSAFPQASLQLDFNSTEAFRGSNDSMNSLEVESQTNGKAKERFAKQITTSSIW